MTDPDSVTGVLSALSNEPPADVIRIFLQMFAVFAGAFGGGIALGRFWFSRSLEIKNATIEQANARTSLLNEMIERAENLEKLKSDAAELQTAYESRITAEDSTRLAELVKQSLVSRMIDATKKSSADKQ